MKKELATFLVLFLLIGPSVQAQDDNLSDTEMEDLSSMMGDDAPVAAKATSEATPATSQEEVSVESVQPTNNIQEASSETVDLETPAEVTTPEVVAPAPAPITPEAAPTISEIPADEDTDSTDLVPNEAEIIEKAEADLPATDIDPETGATAADELEALKSDVGDVDFKVPETKPEEELAAENEEKDSKPTEVAMGSAVFDVGNEEKELLEVAKNLSGQISNNEWNEIATAAKVDTYTVVRNDWLFKISKRIFGTGYYYPKIWSLNSYITNPHLIEPGMILSFTTGSAGMAPDVKLGAFSDEELRAQPGTTSTGDVADFSNFGEDTRPKWIDDKNQLQNQGVYFQYASEETMDDLQKLGKQALNKEYEGYEPPRSDLDIVVPNNYDKSGFDKNSRIFYTFKEGFFLNTFISNNIVQDFGKLTNGPDENILFTKTDHAYIEFDDSMNVVPGDRFSIYSMDGKVKHDNSDREGNKYTITGQIKALRKIQNKWEVEFFEVSGTPQRGDRVTVYTPKIERITKTFNSRIIEAAIVGTFSLNQSIIGMGDVAYLDRGRADGVEMGNVFEVYGFKDRALGVNITDQPTYKTGELTVISLTDNFATVVVSNSIRDFYAGDIAITKTKESALRSQQAKNARRHEAKEMAEGRNLEELDVELNLDNLNDDLLKQADKIQLTEDELAELERQEREKSIIKDSEKDLKALERLENDIEQAESILNEAKIDEDKLLEGENLNDIEQKNKTQDQDSLDEIEENLGKRYIDEDLNTKDNPYGLTEFDVEEIDELLNVEKDQPKKK